jgi:hypothetical protein
MWLCLMGCALAFPASAAARSELSGEAPALTIAEGRASVVDRDGDGIACES